MAARAKSSRQGTPKARRSAGGTGRPRRSAGGTNRPRRPRGVRPSDVDIVHEDEDVIVVDKPARLLTIATAKEARRTLYAWLREYLNRKRNPERVFVVHRLDRDASGLLVFAKSEEAKHRLQAQFRDRTAGRTYLAVVDGWVLDDEGTVRSYLVETKALTMRPTTDLRVGQLAITHFTVRERLARTTLLELRLETGRKHQIRAHLSQLGHPILGDERYDGPPLTPKRLALHATRLAFDHPVTRRRLEFRSRWPRALEFLLSAPLATPDQVTRATAPPAAKHTDTRPSRGSDARATNESRPAKPRSSRPGRPPRHTSAQPRAHAAKRRHPDRARSKSAARSRSSSE